MDYERAIGFVDDALAAIERFANGGSKETNDKVLADLVKCQSVAVHVGRADLRAEMVSKSTSGGRVHHWVMARKACVELRAVLESAEELEEVLGPTGPRLNASALHPLIWQSAARLWDDGHHVQAVQHSSSALEQKLQAMLKRGDVSGKDLANGFSINDPDSKWPRRLRVRGLDRAAHEQAWTSTHNGADHLVRGAFQFIRNGASHPRPNEIDDTEALEQLAVLSTIARILDRCDVIERDAM